MCESDVWDKVQDQIYTVLFQLNKLNAPQILTFENRCKYLCVPWDYLNFINAMKTERQNAQWRSQKATGTMGGEFQRILERRFPFDILMFGVNK